MNNNSFYYFVLIKGTDVKICFESEYENCYTPYEGILIIEDYSTHLFFS
jgi:hypothetical protein